MSKVADGDVLRFHKEIVEFVKKYQFRDREQILCWGISVSQCYILETLYADGEMTAGDLAEKMYLSVSTITRVFDQLEKKGYAERRKSDQDKRVMLCRLTDSGRDIYEKLWGRVSASEKAVLKEFAPDERKLLIQFLRTLNDSAPFAAKGSNG